MLTIQDEADRLNRFVQNLLDMTRLGSGALQPRLDWVDIQDIIGSALERLKKQIVTRPLDIQIDPGLPLVHLDFALIEQVMINILDNACKYSPGGSRIVIQVKLEGRRISITVIDQGPGIPEGERDRVFDMFYRVKTTSQQTSGTGLGLAICRGIVEAHGGTVAASTSAAGRGTEIMVSLPVAEAPPLPAHLDDPTRQNDDADAQFPDGSTAEYQTVEALLDDVQQAGAGPPVTGGAAAGRPLE